jgi:hypothetical protein
VLAAALAVVVLPVVARANPTPDQAATELNTWRTEVGESPVAAMTVAAWNTGCQHHDNYEHENGDALTHSETSGDPGFTTDGAMAAPDSVLAFSFMSGAPTPDASLLPGPTWDAEVFHRADLLQPRLAQIGFDSTTFPSGSQYNTFTCLWLQNQAADPPPRAIDETRTAPALALYPSPANGAYHVPTVFPAGTEFPDPATETGVPAGSTLGWLMNVEINGPWATAGFGFATYAHGVSATLAPDGTSNLVPLVVSQCGPSGCGGPGGTSLGMYFQGGFGIFPTQPLAANTTYRVVLTGGTVTDGSAHVDYPIPAGYSWCFSTGSSYTASSDCAPPTTAAEEVVHPNASTTPSAAPPSSPTPGGVTPGTGTATPPGSTPKTSTPPATTGSSLTGVKRGHPTLTLKLRAAKGAAGITAISIRLPSGLSVTASSKRLRAGLRVTSGAHRRGFKAKVGHGALMITISPAATQLDVRLSAAALKASHTLIKHAKAKHPKALHFTITTTAGGVVTKPKLTLSPR